MRFLRASLLAAVLLTAMACSGAPGVTQPKSISAETVALQQGDVSNMLRCDGSGDIDVVLQAEKAMNPAAYNENAYEWLRWKRQGATDAYFAVFGRTPADCAAISSAGSGAPAGGMEVGLVVKFKDEQIAETTYRHDPTLLGLGPKDILFIRLAGGIVTNGADIGLGPDSKIGSGIVAGSKYYFAFWQNKEFDAAFMGYDVATTDANAAVRAMNGRIH